ncbi:MAG: LamG-like jellyroll fold domain-containing protein [Armatimonadota bacterium]
MTSGNLFAKAFSLFPLLGVLLFCGSVLPAFASGLVAGYSFETLESGAVPDLTGNWPGKVSGQVQHVPWQFGEALVLAGAGFVEIPVTEKFTFSAGITIEAWIAPDKLVAGRLVDRATPGYNDSFCLDTHPGDAIRLITPAGTVSTPKVLSAGRWVHVIAIYDAACGQQAIYVDGKCIVEEPVKSGVTITGTKPLRIGADTQGSSRFSGKVDEVRIYDYPLTDSEIQARYAGKTPAPVTPPAAMKSSISYRNGAQVDFASQLARNDVLYQSPAVHDHEALPIGNGRLCAMVWNGDGLDVQLNHVNNVWFQSSSGRAHLTSRPSLTGKVESFTQRLSLYDGSVRTRCTGAAGQWQATTTVLKGRDVVAIHVEGKLNADTPLVLTLEQWRPAVKPLVEECAAGFVEDLNALQVSCKMALLARADCPVTIAPPRSDYGLQTIEMTLQPPRGADGSISCTVYLANSCLPATDDPAKAARENLAQCVQLGWKALSTEAAARWKDFWSKSFIHLSSPDGTADYMENLWYLHLYWMGCAGEGEYPVKFNGGAFLHYRDSRSWGNHYWYQNTRELYWALPAANHLELCPPLRRLYVGNLSTLRKMTNDLFGKRGVQVEETMSILGAGDKYGNSYTMLYLSTGLECAMQLYHQCVFAHDDATLRNEVLPFMEACVDFFLDYATKEADGLYHLTPVNARETYWRVRDGLTDLVALRVAIPILQRESARLRMFTDKQAQWKEFLTHLAPLPVNVEKDVYAPCVIPATIPPSTNPTVDKLYPPERTTTSMRKIFNSENVELDLFYPSGFIGIGSADYDRALRSYRNRRYTSSAGWDCTSVCAARLGLGDETARVLAEHAGNTQNSPQGFWYSPATTYFANTIPDCPYLDSSGVNATGTTEAVLQSYNGSIRVWPAVPASWEGAYRLRSETGFMVTSERAAGEVRYVEVESLFGDACRVVNPWTDAYVVTCGGKAMTKGKGKEITFPTQKGQRYLIERAGAPVKDMPFAALKPAPNADVKFMGKPANCRRHATATPKPAPRQPMLGISRDGLTPARVAARQNADTAGAAIKAVIGDGKKLAIAGASYIDRAGKSQSAPWVFDGRFSAESIPYRDFIPTAYVIELKQGAMLTAVVWSFDRTGGCYTYAPYQSVKSIVVEISADGKQWQQAGKADFKGAFGQAISLETLGDARFVRVRFLDGKENPAACNCDEIEVY